jgi:hypothetical protein
MKHRLQVILAPFDVKYVEVDVEPGADPAFAALNQAELNGWILNEHQEVLIADADRCITFHRGWQNTEVAAAVDVEVSLREDHRDGGTKFRIRLDRIGDDGLEIPFEGGPIELIRIDRAED